MDEISRSSSIDNKVELPYTVGQLHLALTKQPTLANLAKDPSQQTRLYEYLTTLGDKSDGRPWLTITTRKRRNSEGFRSTKRRDQQDGRRRRRSTCDRTENESIDSRSSDAYDQPYSPSTSPSTSLPSVSTPTYVSATSSAFESLDASSRSVEGSRYLHRQQEVTCMWPPGSESTGDLSTAEYVQEGFQRLQSAEPLPSSSPYLLQQSSSTSSSLSFTEAVELLGVSHLRPPSPSQPRTTSLPSRDGDNFSYSYLGVTIQQDLNQMVANGLDVGVDLDVQDPRQSERWLSYARERPPLPHPLHPPFVTNETDVYSIDNHTFPPTQPDDQLPHLHPQVDHASSSASFLAHQRQFFWS